MVKGIKFEKLDGSNLKIGIVVSRWNSQITEALFVNCKKALLESGVLEENIIVERVPGAYELLFGTRQMIKRGVDAVVPIGCLIKGETMHFEYIAEAVSQGVMNFNIGGDVPVIFGVLTCLSEDQAFERSVGNKNHGYEWGLTAVEMALLT